MRGTGGAVSYTHLDVYKRQELRRIRKEFQGRPTPVSHLERLSASLGNVQLYAKREDLNHNGDHKLNHCMGEALLAKYMGKKKVIAETGAGLHGVCLLYTSGRCCPPQPVPPPAASRPHSPPRPPVQGPASPFPLGPDSTRFPPHPRTG